MVVPLPLPPLLVCGGNSALGCGGNAVDGTLLLMFDGCVGMRKFDDAGVW